MKTDKTVEERTIDQNLRPGARKMSSTFPPQTVTPYLGSLVGTRPLGIS